MNIINGFDRKRLRVEFRTSSFKRWPWYEKITQQLEKNIGS